MSEPKNKPMESNITASAKTISLKPATKLEDLIGKKCLVFFKDVKYIAPFLKYSINKELTVLGVDKPFIMLGTSAGTNCSWISLDLIKEIRLSGNKQEIVTDEKDKKL